MELQQESSNLRALSAKVARNLSSSSSAFVSAAQTPFFSPRSPTAWLPDIVKTDIKTLSSSINLKVNSHGLNIYAQQCEPFSNVKFVESNVSSLCASGNLGKLGPASNGKECLVSNSICNDSSSNNNQWVENALLCCKEKQKKLGRNQGKYTYTRTLSSVTSTNKLRSCDVYIGFHGRKPSLLRFANWLRAELEIQGISCFASDRARCRNSRSHDSVERMMASCSYGVVILTKKSFGNPYSIEELRNFLSKKNLIPIYFDLAYEDCLARDIIEKRGQLWEKYGGELWMLYGGIEREWREAVNGLSSALEWQLEAYDGNWRNCILQVVVLLAKILGRRSILDNINIWRERAENEEFPFPRNEEFVGRKKELSELELILFGDVSGDGETEYFELKTRHRKKSLVVAHSESHKEEHVNVQRSDNNDKGKEPVLWKESEKEIEMHRLGSPLKQYRSLKTRNGGKNRKKRPTKVLYGKGIACVSGDSGIGKTELVLEYAYRFSQRYKMVLWVGGETRYIRQNYLALSNFLDIDVSSDNNSLEKGNIRCFEEQEDEAIARLRKELMRDIPFLVIIDNLENEKDWWDQKFVMDLLPRFGGETHFIITTRLPRVMNLEPMKLSFLSSIEALCLMRGSIKDYPIVEIDALKAIEEKLGRLTLGLAIVGSILSELPLTPIKLLDTINRMPLRDMAWTERDFGIFKRNTALIQLLDVCLSIFDHADGPRSLATRIVQVSGWFAPSAIPLPLLALAAHKVSKKHHDSSIWKKCWRAISCTFTRSSMKRSEIEASSMLIRFGIGRKCLKTECIQFHELIRIYARKRGGIRVAKAVIQAASLRGSISQCPDHLWAACFLLLGFRGDSSVVEARSSELLFFVKRVVIPLAISTFITFSRCNAALELLRLATDALEAAAESLMSRSEKWTGRSFCFTRRARHRSQYRYMWQELALMRATVLETRAKLLLRGAQYDIGDDLIRKAIFIRKSICGEHHPDTISAQETLSKLTKLLTQVQIN